MEEKDFEIIILKNKIKSLIDRWEIIDERADYESINWFINDLKDLL